MDELEFVVRLKEEFEVCLAWECVARVEVHMTAYDLNRNQLRVVLKPAHGGECLVRSFVVNVDPELFPPDNSTINGAPLSN